LRASFDSTSSTTRNAFGAYPFPVLSIRTICAGLLVLIPLVVSLFVKDTAHSNEIPKAVGANACAECHTKEATVWKNTRHYRTFREMPRSKKARQIGRKLGIKRIKADPLCLGCHFTKQEKRGAIRVTAGVSCESCHGAAENWIKVHSEFSGNPNRKAETASEAALRWKQSVAHGMIRKDALYGIAKNCYGCHVVPNEKLVNVGGHPAGSAFELVSWSQGEVRHNLWYNNGNQNALAGTKRRRMMYLIGLSVELETALRAIAVATKFEDYAIRMAHRANQARIAIKAAAKRLPHIPEIASIVRHAHSAGLKLANKKALYAAADKVAAEAKALADRYDGGKLAGIDELIPDKSKYVGQPTSSN